MSFARKIYSGKIFRLNLETGTGFIFSETEGFYLLDLDDGRAPKIEFDEVVFGNTRDFFSHGDQVSFTLIREKDCVAWRVHRFAHTRRWMRAESRLEKPFDLPSGSSQTNKEPFLQAV